MAAPPGAERTAPVSAHRVRGQLRRSRVLAAVVALLAGTCAGVPASANADDATATTLPPASPGPPPSETDPVAPVLPPLAPSGADEAGRLRAQVELHQSELQLKVAAGLAKKVNARVAPAEARYNLTRLHLAQLTAAERAAADELEAARTRLRALAVARFVTSGATQSVNYLLRASGPADLSRRRALVDTAADIQTGAVANYQQAHDGVSAQLDEAVRAVDDSGREQAQVLAEAQATNDLVDQLAKEVDNRRLLLDLVTAGAPVEPSDIPRLFLDAYRKAAAAMTTRAPGCRIGWTALAGIGRIESNHGRFRGAQLAINGDIYPRILGIPLDGSRGTSVIRDTDGGLLDGDPTVDRAVGPMQFIPATWKRVGVDGNGDGIVDPGNAYDATVSAAAYLCRANPAGGLDTEEGLKPALFSYNHSDAYVATVLSVIHSYDSMIPDLPPPPPSPPRRCTADQAHALMEREFSTVETRVVGSLIEKQLATPEYYPLTARSLLAACNQSSNRSPVVNYDEPTVVEALDALRAKGAVRVVHSPGQRAPKYRHIVDEELALDRPEAAVLCVLLLRGAQTPGELRSRTERMHAFDDTSALEAALAWLADREMVRRLERQPGQKEARWAHLFGTEIDAPAADATEPDTRGSPDRITQLEQQVAQLRADVDELKRALGD